MCRCRRGGAVARLIRDRHHELVSAGVEVDCRRRAIAAHGEHRGDVSAVEGHGEARRVDAAVRVRVRRRQLDRRPHLRGAVHRHQRQGRRGKRIARREAPSHARPADDAVAGLPNPGGVRTRSARGGSRDDRAGGVDRRRHKTRD